MQYSIHRSIVNGHLYGCIQCTGRKNNVMKKYIYYSALISLLILIIPLIVAANGAGRIRQAPHKSTMQRFLIMTKVTILFLISLLMMLMITLQLVIILTRRMKTITLHCKGWEKRKTAPLVLTCSGERIME